MTADIEKYWKTAWEQLRRNKGLEILTPEKAEEEYLNAPDEPLSQEQRESIIKRVLENSDEKAPTLRMPHLSERPSLPASVGTEFACLNRNKQEDAGAEELLKKIREEALNGSGCESGISRKRKTKGQ